MERCQETKLMKLNQTKLKINQILKKSNFPKLNPQMDNDGCFIRAGVHLKNVSYLQHIMKHPTVLPRKHWLTKLIARHHHKKNFHTAKTNHILTESSTRFWNLNAKEGPKKFKTNATDVNKNKKTREDRSLPNFQLFD